MKKSKRDMEPVVGREQWFRLAMCSIPELEQASYDPSDSIQLLSICEDIAYIADAAHRATGSEALLHRCYQFIRWSLQRVEDERLRGWIADWFFDRLLQLPSSKAGCLDYLDWGDASSLMDNFTTEPSFEDVENFDRLCKEWKRRWALNQKLPQPNNIAEQAAT